MKGAEQKVSPPDSTSPWVRRASSKVHGTGLYATKSIPAGTRIIEYVGERITKKEADRRDREREESQEKGGDGCVYVFELNKRYDIDGAVSWNTARLINHSCDPNCATDNVRGHIWITAARDIEEGEELSYDYGFDWSNWYEHPCRCGAANCLGFIVKQNQRWRVRRALADRKRSTTRGEEVGGATS